MPRSNRVQIRCQVWPLSELPVARIASASVPATARWRNAQRRRVVVLSRRILSASQALKVLPQPGRRCRLLQKIRRARSVFRWGVLSSNPVSEPCRMSVPIFLQWGHAVCLSRSVSAAQSCSSR